MKKVWGEVIQLGGLLAITAGIVIEIIYKAHIGFVAITAGSLFGMIGTKIKHDENFPIKLANTKKEKKYKRKKK